MVDIYHSKSLGKKCSNCGAVIANANLYGYCFKCWQRRKIIPLDGIGVDKLNLDKRIKDILYAHGIERANILGHLDDNTLHAIPGIGWCSIYQIRKATKSARIQP